MPRKKKLFLGRSRLIIDPGGKIRDFYTRAFSKEIGEKQLQRKMNKVLGHVPEAFVPMEVAEVAEELRA